MKITVSLVDYHLDQLANIIEYNPLASRHLVAKAAIQAGLELFMKDPQRTPEYLTRDLRDDAKIAYFEYMEEQFKNTEPPED